MLAFAKGGAGSAKSPVRTPDTLTSNDTVEVLLGISEGPIKGLVNGPKSFRADDTALVNESGEPNFKNFGLDVWPGDEAGHSIRLDLGGFSSPIPIGVTLASGSPVTRTGLVPGIGAVDFRIVVQSLLKQNDDGTFPNTLSLKFEVKKTTDTAWSPAWISEASSDFSTAQPGSGTTQSWRSFTTTQGASSFALDIPTLAGNGVPTGSPPGPSAAYIDEATGELYRWNDAGNVWGLLNEDSATDTYLLYSDGRRLYPTWGIVPNDARAGDLWWSAAGALLIFNGAVWVKGWQFAQPATNIATDGVWTVEHKVSSNTPKDIRIFLGDDPDATWEYRVTKLSPDSTETEISMVQWEAVQEINLNPMTFYGVALARVIGQASDQFSSFPNWNGDWDGRIVKVPSNYDPEARTYTGIWDGTFKIAWSNNPAWVLMDFIENDRYGLSSLYPHVVNKWKFYEFGVYCDTLVERVDGTMRPRWTFNDYIQEPRDAKEMAQYIAGSAGALYCDDGNGIVDLVIDKDENAVALFTPENIGEDGFSYSYTDRLTRANEVIVEFVNPALNWQADKRIVRDEDDIALFGRITDNFIAVGCTDADEALARARRRLIGGLTEKETVTFTTNRKGKYLSEWNVILCADPQMGRGLTGRIRAKTSSTTVTLRDPISLEPGFTYWATFDHVGAAGFETVRIQLATGAGSHTSLEFSSPLPNNLPPYATFALEADGIAGLPKPYRILNIQDDSGNGEVIQITALELNRNKYAYTDTGIDQGEIDYSNVTGDPEPPTDLAFTIETVPVGPTFQHNGVLNWTASASRWVRRYEVFQQIDAGPLELIKTVTGTSAEILGLQTALYTFHVVAVSITDKRSKPGILKFDMRGDYQVRNAPQNLHLVDAYTETVFDTTDAKFAWEPPAELIAGFSHYRIDLVDIPTNTRFRNINVGQVLEWVYPFAEMAKDGLGTPRRSFRIEVRAIDGRGHESPPATLQVANVAPAAPVLSSVTGVFGGVQLTLSTPADRDVAGVLIWISPTEGFNPVTTPPVLDTSYQRSIIAGTQQTGPVYVRAAYYDSFSKNVADLNISAEIEASANTLDLGGRTAEEWQEDFEEALALGRTVTQQADDLADAVMEAMMTGEKNRAVSEARAFIDGQPIGSFVRNEQERTNELVSVTNLLGVKGADGLSFYLNETTVKFGPTESLAERFESIVTQRNAAIDAAFVSKASLWEDGINFLGETLDFIGFRAPGGGGFIIDKNTLMWNGSESLAEHLESIQSEAEDGIAQATSDIKTWVNTSSAGAQWIQTLEVQYGGDFRGTFSDVTQITSEIGGRKLVAFDINGVVTGYEVMNDGEQGGFTIYADYFGLVDPNGGNPVIPFKYEGGRVYLKDVWAEKLRVGSASRRGGLTDNSVFSFSGEANLLFFNYSAVGGDAMISGEVSMEGPATGNSTVLFRLYRDSGNGYELIKGWEYAVTLPNGDHKSFWATDLGLEPGNHTYKITGEVDSGPACLKRRAAIFVSESFA